MLFLKLKIAGGHRFLPFNCTRTCKHLFIGYLYSDCSYMYDPVFFFTDLTLSTNKHDMMWRLKGDNSFITGVYIKAAHRLQIELLPWRTPQCWPYTLSTPRRFSSKSFRTPRGSGGWGRLSGRGRMERSLRVTTNRQVSMHCSCKVELQITLSSEKQGWLQQILKFKVKRYKKITVNERVWF